MNLFLNEIFKTILVNNDLKKDALKKKISFVPIYIQKKYMATESRYNLHSSPEINVDDDEIIVNKLNLLLDLDKKLWSLDLCLTNKKIKERLRGCLFPSINVNIYICRRHLRKPVISGND